MPPLMEEFEITVMEILKTGRNAYDATQKLREVLRIYNLQNLNYKKKLYDMLIEFCDHNCQNSNPRFEQCKIARLNRYFCTSCPLWKLKSELGQLLKLYQKTRRK